MIHYILDIASGLIVAVVPGIIVWLRSMRRRQRSESDAITDALRVILLSTMEQKHKEIMSYGDVSREQAKVFDNLYSSYHGLGGNGYGTKLYKDVMNMKSYNCKDEDNGD